MMDWAMPFAPLAVLFVFFPLAGPLASLVALIILSVVGKVKKAGKNEIVADKPNIYTKEVFDVSALRRPLVEHWIRHDTPCVTVMPLGGLDALELYENSVKLIFDGKKATCHFGYAFDKQQPRVENVIAVWEDGSFSSFKGTPLKKPSESAIKSFIGGCLEQPEALRLLNDLAAEAITKENVTIPYEKFKEFGIEDTDSEEVRKAIKDVLVEKNGFTGCTIKEDGVELSMVVE